MASASRKERGGWGMQDLLGAAVWPQTQPSFPGQGLPLWNALDLRLRLLTPLECPVLAGLGEWESA